MSEPDAEKIAREWTPEWLANYGTAEDWLKSICDAHNKAVAQARAPLVEALRQISELGDIWVSHKESLERALEIADAALTGTGAGLK